MVDLPYHDDTPTWPTMTSVDMYTAVHKGVNATASTSSSVLVLDPPGYTELDDVTAKGSFFKNPELMEKTFSHLQVEDDKKYRSLFSAALTSKNFLDVALDALWKELDTLVPLLKLLPSLQVEDEVYVCANVHAFLYDLILSLGPCWESVSSRLG
jgi:hypothetical protein